MLETAIVKSRKMDAMERVRMDTILEEQLLGQADLTTSRGEIGNLIGIDYMILSPNELHYWAPHPVKRIKVDFLLRRGNELAAIEVMSQPRYRTGMLPGLRAIGELPGLVRRVLVYGGKRSFRPENGIEVWSVARLQQVPAGISLWPGDTQRGTWPWSNGH